MTQPPTPGLSRAPENDERWREVCAQVVLEKDQIKLSVLLEELDDLLEARERRLHDLRAKSPLEVDGDNAPPKTLP